MAVAALYHGEDARERQQVLSTPSSLRGSEATNSSFKAQSVTPAAEQLVTACTMVNILAHIILILDLVSLALASPKRKVHKKATVSLPTPSQFGQQKGSKWNITYVGGLNFTGSIGSKKLMGDKCRSSVVAGQNIWNCGDMQCSTSSCGFSMGPAFLGTNSVSVINSSAYTSVTSYTFLEPWSGDPAIKPPQTMYGMDTSDVVAVNATHGIAYGRQITRGGSGVADLAAGNAVAWVTIGANQPVATRVGPLLTNGSYVEMGLSGTLNAGGYIYNYMTAGAFGNIIVGRVPVANQAAFNASKYEYLLFPSSLTASPVWTPGIPLAADASKYGMRTAQSGSRFYCIEYGSVFFNNYFNQYMLTCNLYYPWIYFYLAPNPWGPWTAGYQIFSASNATQYGYGVNVHANYSPNGSHQVLYLSESYSGTFSMYKLSFGY